MAKEAKKPIKGVALTVKYPDETILTDLEKIRKRYHLNTVQDVIRLFTGMGIEKFKNETLNVA